MRHRPGLVLLLLTSLMASFTCAAQPAEQPPDRRVLVTVSAETSHLAPHAPGSWSMAITRDWLLEARLGSAKLRPRTLSPREQKRLKTLLADQPKAKPHYAFGCASELSTVFFLAVPGAGTYVLSDSPQPESETPAPRSTINLLLFLHGLLEAPEAAKPPAPER